MKPINDNYLVQTRAWLDNQLTILESLVKNYEDPSPELLIAVTQLKQQFSAIELDHLRKAFELSDRPIGPIIKLLWANGKQAFEGAELVYRTDEVAIVRYPSGNRGQFDISSREDKKKSMLGIHPESMEIVLNFPIGDNEVWNALKEIEGEKN